MMKKYIFSLFVMLVSVVPQELSAQVDHTILEVWIQNHKKTSNRLKERIATQGTAAATELMREDRTDEVKQKIDTLTQRNKLAMSDLTLLFDAAGIVTQVRETADITVDAIDLALALSVKHPDVLTRAQYLENRSAEKIEDVYKLVAAVISSGLGASLATTEQRYRFVQEIKARVLWIRENMYAFYKHCRYLQLMGDFNTFDSLTIQQILDKDGPAVRRAYDNAIKSLDKLNLW